VRLIGTGPGSTIIRGGGPVVTIGTFNATEEPIVSIDAVTITGGVTHSSPESVPFVGSNGVIADGGGVYVPFGAKGALGATVRITDSAITGNRVAATRTVPIGPPCPGGVSCPFALSRGGGVASFGMMTLVNTVVRDNVAAGVASDAVGAGVFSSTGNLTVRKSAVFDNRAMATVPNGRFAEGGGLFVDSGDQLSITNSLISDNVASLHNTLPAKAGGQVIELAANSGGAHVGGDVARTSILDTVIRDNQARATDLNGEPVAFDAGILVGGGRLVMSHSVISGNKVEDTAKTSADVGGSGSAVEIDSAGVISDTRVVNNPSVARSPDGIAQVSGGLAVLSSDGNARPVKVLRSVIAANTAQAVTDTGKAAVYGAGVLNNSLLTFNRVVVRGNRGRASGPDATAQGGGIWNGVLYSGPPVRLTLNNSQIIGNSLWGSAGATLQGGGVYTSMPVNRYNSNISRNIPDQCFGCGHSKSSSQRGVDTQAMPQRLPARTDSLVSAHH
jgi:hypothetical protein